MCVAAVVLYLIYVRSGGTAANATAKDYDNSLFKYRTVCGDSSALCLGMYGHLL